jgi:hypothetical protein
MRIMKPAVQKFVAKILFEICTYASSGKCPYKGEASSIPRSEMERIIGCTTSP